MDTGRHTSSNYRHKHRYCLGCYTGQVDASGDSGSTHHQHTRWTTARSQTDRAETRQVRKQSFSAGGNHTKMNSISIGRLVVVVLIAFVASFATVFGDGVRTAEAKDIAELGAVMALYGSKAVAAGVSAAMSAALGFLTMPFKGTGINALKVGK